MPTLKLNLLHNDPRNANVCTLETKEKIQRHIERTGLYPPLIVRPHPNQKGQYIILDGHHRKQILQKLGYTEAECQVWEVNEPEALLALATLNRLRGEDAPRKRAELIQELLKTVSVSDLDQLLPESEGQIQDLIALLELDWDEVDAKVRKQIEQEEKELPIPFACMIQACDYPLIEQAFSKLEGDDQGQRLVTLCRYYLTNGDQTHE